uniref:Uncharacterized protein n=1 Tax=Ditylenchus dipsaci TaxID=166011 RepID=A0A915ERJ8_9BILA
MSMNIILSRLGLQKEQSSGCANNQTLGGLSTRNRRPSSALSSSSSSVLEGQRTSVTVVSDSREGSHKSGRSSPNPRSVSVTANLSPTVREVIQQQQQQTRRVSSRMQQQHQQQNSGNTVLISNNNHLEAAGVAASKQSLAVCPEDSVVCLLPTSTLIQP